MDIPTWIVDLSVVIIESRCLNKPARRTAHQITEQYENPNKFLNEKTIIFLGGKQKDSTALGEGEIVFHGISHVICSGFRFHFSELFLKTNGTCLDMANRGGLRLSQASPEPGVNIPASLG